MTSTITNIKRISLGSAEAVLADWDITSYPTNGEALTGALLGLSTTLDAVFIIGTEHGTDQDHIPYWDEANGKVVFSVGSTGSEVANTTNLGTHRVLAIAHTG